MTTLPNPKTLNCPMTSSQLSTFTPVEIWDDVGTLKRARKIQFFPTKKQKRKLIEWIGTSRYVYNKCLNGVKTNQDTVDCYKLRDKYVTSGYNKKPIIYLYDLFYSDKYNYQVKDWELETPKDIRAGAVRDLCKAYKTCFSNLKEGNIKTFNMNFRSKRKSSSIEIPKSAIKWKNGKMNIYKSYINSDIRLCKDKTLKHLDIKYDCRMKYIDGKFYLVVPMDRKIVNKNPKYKESCSIDPGVRKFNTIYSDKIIFTIQLRKEILKKLHTKLDNFNRLRSKGTIKLSRYRRKIKKVYTTLDNCIDDMHNQTINLLTSTFETIYLPAFESQEIGKVNKNSKVRRNLFQQKHFKYKTKLIDKCSTLKDVNVVICTEEYTSKTCTKCGILNNVGSSEIYKCNKCNLILDRDINGSRNILIKNLIK